MQGFFSINDHMEYERFLFDSVTSVLVVFVSQGAGCWEFVIESSGQRSFISDRGYGSHPAAMRGGLTYLLDGV